MRHSSPRRDSICDAVVQVNGLVDGPFDSPLDHAADGPFADARPRPPR
ncbi:hypothetical protein [Pseudonocardia alni]|nr:hypothetical protein PaSha_01135 [Pseudonocardia alni]